MKPGSHRLLLVLLLVLACLVPNERIIAEKSDSGKTPKIISEIDPFDPAAGAALDVNYNRVNQYASEAFKKEEYLLAAKYYLFIVRYSTPDAMTLYNLACCYARLKKPELTIKYLKYAVDAGFDNLDHLLKDEDLAVIEKNNEFRLYLKYINRLKDAQGKTILLPAVKALPAKIHLPEDFTPDKKYKLLIALHGRGHSAEKFSAIWSHVKRKEFIMVSPSGPYNISDSTSIIKRSSWYLLTRDKKIWEIADPLVVDYMKGIVLELKNRYKISDIYILGFSQGVSASFYSAIKNPGLFKGVIAFAGVLPDEEFISNVEYQKAKNLRIFITHGDKDSQISKSKSSEAKTTLESFGYKVAFHSFEGGHFVDPAILNKAVEWMLND